ncbi:hypothetical protein ACFVWG_32765 [Kribbella sp. NPDC058245]|uniref:hypothetical protein n=1 Tax=Kribbella sp. NPDC058245 TaxID=3346399 RepID=UPI0036E6A91E
MHPGLGPERRGVGYWASWATIAGVVIAVIGTVIAHNDAKPVIAPGTAVTTPGTAVSTPPAQVITTAPSAPPPQVTTKAPVNTVAAATPYRVPKGFVGTWRGPIDQSGSKPYSVIVTVASGAVGDSLGTVEYPELQCQGIWRLESGTANSIRVTELIDGGTTCIQTVSITLILQDGQLRYYIEDPQVRGTLKRGS